MSLWKRSDAPEDRRGIIVVSALTVIAARKVDFASGLLSELRKSPASVDGQFLSRTELEKAEKKIVEIVARLDWELFVTKEERERRVLNPEAGIEDLDRIRLWKGVQDMLREAGLLPKVAEREGIRLGTSRHSR